MVRFNLSLELHVSDSFRACPIHDAHVRVLFLFKAHYTMWVLIIYVNLRMYAS